jgi:hypothetical protein
MRIRRPSPLLLSLGLFFSFGLVGCATGGSGGANVYRKEIGKVMVVPLTTARDKIFGKYTIPMYRETDTERSIFWESQWMPRGPAPEELDQGVDGARNRVLIRGNYVEERLDGTAVLRVRFEVENQIQTQMDPQWHPGPMPPTVEERFQEVYDDLMLELRAGIIR